MTVKELIEALKKLPDQDYPIADDDGRSVMRVIAPGELRMDRRDDE